MNETEKIIDLHMHSVNSDGTKTIDELLSDFERLQIDIASFTDHDSVKGYYDLEKSKVKLSKEVIIVPGVELSFVYNGELRDMLGYGIDIPKIDDFIEERYSQEKRIEKQRMILEKFQNNCLKLDLIFDEIKITTGNKNEAYFSMHKSINNYPENIEKQPCIVDNTRFYWDHYTNKESPFFVDETVGLPTIKEVVEVIHNSGGLAFLAHPFNYGMSGEKTTELINDAIESEIDGIEIMHYSNKENTADFLKDIANKNNLYMSGGSDYHGSTKPTLHLVTAYENIKVNYEYIKPWLNEVNLISHE